jgi:hypothetical protein
LCRAFSFGRIREYAQEENPRIQAN